MTMLKRPSLRAVRKTEPIKRHRAPRFRIIWKPGLIGSARKGISLHARRTAEQIIGNCDGAFFFWQRHRAAPFEKKFDA